MTVTEFLYPLRSAPRTIQVQASLYFAKFYVGKPTLAPSEIKAYLVSARVPGARGVNVSQALANSGPAAHRPDGTGWELTNTGEQDLERRYGVARPRPDGGLSATDGDIAELRALAGRVPDAATQDYVEEAVVCLEAGARRAAVVFLWSGAIPTLRDMLWQCGVSPIEQALHTHNPKAKFRKKSDFEGVKDADLLQVAHDLSIIDKSEKKRLSEALDLRNDCGHPVKYRPGEKKVASFIEDVVGILWPKGR